MLFRKQDREDVLNRTSSNPNRGQDFHLRMLGIEDRADWEIISIDSMVFETELARGRPDWVIRHRDGRRYMTVDYKNRELGKNGQARPYEKYQVTVYAMLLEELIAREQGIRVEVEPVLLYADGESVTVAYSAEDEERILEAGTVVGTRLYLLGLKRRPDEIPAVTELARFLVDPAFTDASFGWTAAQQAGEEAHASLQQLGPVVWH